MRHFDAKAIANATPWPALIAALRTAFEQGCEVPPRHSHAIGQAGTALLMPAWRDGGFFGIKTVTIFPRNGAAGLPAVHGIYALFSARTGEPLAVMDGGELTARRTAAASALAADFLARREVRHLLIVGAGRVAALLPEAMCSVRPGLSHITVWNRNPPAAAALAARLCQRGFAASAIGELEGAVRRADMVSCATLSTTALVHGAWLRPGTHLDLIGSFTPQMREADGKCIANGRVFVDTEEALDKSGDMLSAIEEGCFGASTLAGTLAQLCRGERSGRLGAGEITVFKSVGTALEDLAAAELAYSGDAQAGIDNPGLPQA